MAYTVLARRYRSQAFGDVVGQDAVAQTLKNAIQRDRVAHAYLFCGTRGVGKTSMARLFARALNAPATMPDAPQPSDVELPETDVQQRMADAIMRGDDLNVIEIDAASNNSVDNARELIANAGLAPTANARFKIYIIDEVHMLSNQAFNALLKTMEEPPEHVKFILCTTDPHKVPPTIQSRCQRFDFPAIPTARITEHLKAVVNAESLDAEDDLVYTVARLGNGSMRDALSLLDRVIAAAGDDKLTVTTLETLLGLPETDLIDNLVNAAAQGDVAATLRAGHDLLARGVSQEQVVETLIERLRQLMLVAACGPDADVVELSDEARKTTAQLAAHFDTDALVYLITLADNLQRHAKQSANPRALFDAVLARMALAEKMADVAAILAGNTTPTQKKKP
ncbi:DNA polymerase III subunit gamma/tau [Mucisphaera calidilacus]|uniref:DNA polymerase III subunit gamma/tau n=1 Tax=Mucisphaera calidilacus TaxID=2527982 RepID=A0A518BY05_9BACT|nr:DNA polymerase III subunit gamma/tau [Mucisphaera calidilacus]QDU71838.1 DNA polymerase III subunit tau [Mucisphaera calidilacus]